MESTAKSINNLDPSSLHKFIHQYLQVWKSKHL